MPTPVGFAREFLQITQESAYKTPVGTITRGTNQIPIRLTGANFFTMRAEPQVVEIPYGGGLNVTATTISDKTGLKGTLQTELCYSQAAFLLGWALQKNNGTLPWTTTEPLNQFASCTVDHAIWDEDTATYKRTRYLGVKVDAGKLESSEDSQKTMLSLDLVGSTYQGNTYDSSSDPTSTVFPQPLDTEYVSDFVLFTHSGGGLTLGSAWTQYTSLGISWQNSHQVLFYANRFANQLRSYGRKLKLDADVILLASPDLRAAYQTLAAQTVSAVWTNTTHTITADFKTNARIEAAGDNLALDKMYNRKVSIGSRYDSANNVDFGFTFA